jgi:hypothetical protein
MKKSILLFLMLTANVALAGGSSVGNANYKEDVFATEDCRIDVSVLMTDYDLSADGKNEVLTTLTEKGFQPAGPESRLRLNEILSQGKVKNKFVLATMDSFQYRVAKVNYGLGESKNFILDEKGNKRFVSLVISKGNGTYHRYYHSSTGGVPSEWADEQATQKDIAAVAAIQTLPRCQVK